MGKDLELLLERLEQLEEAVYQLKQQVAELRDDGRNKEQFVHANSRFSGGYLESTGSDD
jgi:cell division protein FtsB